MMSVSGSISSGKASAYHKDEFTSEEKKEGVKAGVWRGKLAEELNLVGEIVKADFEAIAAGRDPRTGKVLVRSRGVVASYVNKQGRTVKPVSHRAAFDAQFAPPKSVSVAALLDSRLIEAHNAAVTHTIQTVLEPSIQARTGSHSVEATGRGVFAVFQHHAARPVKGFAAPQLHSHVMVMNVTRTAAGRTYSLQPLEIFKAQRHAGEVYGAALARRVMRLGYELSQTAGASFEIKGYSKAFLKSMSPRTYQIKAHMQRLKLTSPAAGQIAALVTRAEKDSGVTTEVTWGSVKVQAVLHGVDPEAILARAQVRGASQSQSPAIFIPRGGPTKKAALVKAAEEGEQKEATQEYARTV